MYRSIMKIQFIAFLLVKVVASSNAQSSLEQFKSLISPEKRVDFVLEALKLKAAVENKLQTERMTLREGGKPAFCGKHDCPSFVLMNKTKYYETRCYEGAIWVSTMAVGYPNPLGGKMSEMYKRLQKYISGANKKEAIMNMTVPILVEVKGKGKKRDMKMSFYIPRDFQLTPPKPTDEDVFLEGKEFCAYVRSFDGYKTSFGEYMVQVLILKIALAKDGLKDAYVNDLIFGASYDDPWKIFNRHNEVILIKA